VLKILHIWDLFCNFVVEKRRKPGPNQARLTHKNAMKTIDYKSRDGGSYIVYAEETPDEIRVNFNTGLGWASYPKADGWTLPGALEDQDHADDPDWLSFAN